MSRLRAALALTLFVGLAGAMERPARFAPLSPPAGPPVEWITANRDGILVGSRQRVYGAELAGKLELSERGVLGDRVTGAVAVGSRLLLVEDGRRLAILEHDSVEPRALELLPRARGDLTLAVAGDVLVLAVNGEGLRFRQILSSHHHGHFELARLGRLPLRETFTALAATGRTVWAATAATLYEIDFSAPAAPRVVAGHPLTFDVRALAANDDRVLALGGALILLERVDGELVVTARVPDVPGDALQMNGRVVYVAGPRGVQAWRDSAEGGQTHAVTVGNDFFSPANLVIEAGDAVSWTNAALGGFHNVESCVPTINGCDGQTANEAFTSGPVAGPVWTYAYTFVEPGRNDYVCIAHLPFMTGTVHVGGIRVRPQDIQPTLPAAPASRGLRY